MRPRSYLQSLPERSAVMVSDSGKRVNRLISARGSDESPCSEQSKGNHQIERRSHATPGRQHVPDPGRRDAGARRPGGGPGRVLRPRRLVGRLLGRRHERVDGTGHGQAVRPAPRPEDLRDLRRPLAEPPRRARRRAAEQRPEVRGLADARDGRVEQLDPARGRRCRGGRRAQARGRPGDPGARQLGPAPDAARARSDRRAQRAGLPGRARDREASLRRRRRPRRADAGRVGRGLDRRRDGEVQARGRDPVRIVRARRPAGGRADAPGDAQGGLSPPREERPTTSR